MSSDRTQMVEQQLDPTAAEIKRILDEKDKARRNGESKRFQILRNRIERLLNDYRIMSAWLIN
jgi:hypothetical protein